ncbi:MAG: SLC13 family permease [Patiriisocius sp.]|uniref:SLC13 family permease n=1 Tax=Patiriisocius sp. TaxID=2822396 RepID=UPI003EFA1C47
MELSILLVFIIIGITVILFVTELFPVDKISFFIIVALLLLGIVTPEEAISGFSNPATITVLSLMILAVGLEDNGVIQLLTNGIKKMKLLPLILITPAFMIVSATVSAFISTTAVVIIFIKIVTQLSEKYNFSSAKLLMPISFAGILGGSCTLMGTSTNIIVNAVAKERGAEGFSFFEFSLYGLVFLAIGIVVMTIGSRFLPKGTSNNVRDDYAIDSYIFTVKISEESKLIGERLEKFSDASAVVLKLIRDKNVLNAPGKYIDIKKGDNFVLMSDLDSLQKFVKEYDLSINDKRETEQEEEVKDGEKEEESQMTYVELLILPGSNLIGRTLKQLRKATIMGAFPIAIKKRRNIRNTQERLLRKSLHQINLKPGDRLLLELQEQKISKLYDLENVAILNQHENTPVVPKKNTFIAISILLLVIGLASSGVISILSASLTGVAAMLLFNIITLNNIYHRVNWQIVFLLAGMIPLGVAMTNSGADVWLSGQLLEIMSGKTPAIVLGLMFGMTMVLSGFISNNATAIIMTPIAIAVATGLSLEMKPFILAVMFGANFSFFTPVGYQTNALIYGTGIYKFKHFLILGGILSLILLATGTFILSTLL